MALKHRLLNERGITLLELLVASILMSVVLGGAAAIYVSGVRFLGQLRTTTTASMPPSLNAITRRIDIANQVALSQGGSQLDLRCDCDFATLTPQNATPYNPADDQWAHIRIVMGAPNGEVRMVIDNVPGTTVNPGDGTLLYSNINSAGPDAQGNRSGFALLNPSGAGNATLVETTLVFTDPATTLKTRTAIGSGAKS